MNPKPSGESTSVTSSPTDQSQSLHQSSSQFFYFLRLMQLFPETHPATLHTVLSLCKNDFFCAVDKLLYARRCKSVFTRNQAAGIRRHPFCRGHSYYCYTNESGQGTKRPWSADHANLDTQQETTEVVETVVTLNTEEEVENKEVLDLTIKHEVVKSTLATSAETHRSLKITNSPDCLPNKNCQSSKSEI